MQSLIGGQPQEARKKSYKSNNGLGEDKMNKDQESGMRTEYSAAAVSWKRVSVKRKMVIKQGTLYFRPKFLRMLADESTEDGALNKSESVGKYRLKVQTKVRQHASLKMDSSLTHSHLHQMVRTGAMEVFAQGP